MKIKTPGGIHSTNMRDPNGLNGYSTDFNQFIIKP